MGDLCRCARAGGTCGLRARAVRVPPRMGFAGFVAGLFFALLAFFVGSVVMSLPGCTNQVPQDGEPIHVLTQFGQPGRFPGQFDYPRGLDLYGPYPVVVDKAARVQVIDPDSGRALVWWRMPEWDLGKPTGVTVAVHPYDPNSGRDLGRGHPLPPRDGVRGAPGQ